MLLHACRLVEDFDGASWLQAAVDQLGLKARLSIATALVQGSMHCLETASDIDDTSNAQQLWFELRLKMSYVSLLQALRVVSYNVAQAEDRRARCRFVPRRKPLLQDDFKQIRKP